MELSGEYVGPDGEQQRLRVLCDGTGDADSLQNLLSGVTQMKELVSDFFGPLVQQEAQGRVAPDDTLDVKNMQRKCSEKQKEDGRSKATGAA
ncbi:EKC/KEOPS complex subunit GON7 isoform X2 [Marmota flaviventris]|uniref:EKC/KEOPS complex subunit GON7 isoform X2 n=1 Tax=Marmota flaviventris TaxID=93162 RepID=UPI003A88C761